MATAAPAMPHCITFTKNRSRTRLMPPARSADFKGVMGSQAARKKALVTNMTNAAGAPKHLQPAIANGLHPLELDNAAALCY